MHASDQNGDNTGPVDLEEALWCAVDHARKYGEHAVAAQLLLILQDLPSRWQPVRHDGVRRRPTIDSLRQQATETGSRARVAQAGARPQAPGGETGHQPLTRPLSTGPTRRLPPI